jgi:hypothetical protein
MNEKVVGSMSEWSGMFKDFFRQIADGSITREHFKDFLEHRLFKTTASFQVWKTITLGVHDSIAGYRKALTSAGFGITDSASELLDKIQVSTTQVKLDLVRVTVEELGFTKDVSLGQVFARARKIGFELCPAEVGPALRLEYEDRSLGNATCIAMKPITDSFMHSLVFELVHGLDGRVLNSDDGISHGRDGNFWDPVQIFVFVCPRK